MTKIEGEGYRLSYRILRDILEQGNSAIADSVNPFKFTREEWQEVATSIGSKYVNVEVVCSDKEVHKKRAETRSADIDNAELPTWEDILNREYDEWDSPRIKIDTAGRSIEQSVAELISSIDNENLNV